MPKHTALPGLSADLFRHWLALFGKTTATLPNEALRERANDLAGRIADSLWYGYQLSRQTDTLPRGAVMDSAILSLLGAFVLSIIGLFVFIWSLRKGLLVENPAAASVIFARGEIGRVDDPALADAGRRSMQQAATPAEAPVLAADAAELRDRIASDRSTAFPVFMFVAFACFWLLVGSLAGLTSSIKLHEPDWLTEQAWLTFGRIRTVHLTAVLYGWITNAALGMIAVAVAAAAAHPPARRGVDHAGRRADQHRHRGRHRRRVGGLVRRHGVPRDAVADRRSSCWSASCWSSCRCCSRW